MSAVAGLCAARGFTVYGSDDKTLYDPARSVLDRFRIPYTVGFTAEPELLLVSELVVVSAGIESNNIELEKARQSGIKIVSYPELLAALTIDERRIVVVGTNGKSSTSALLGFLLANLNDSSFFVGGVLRQYGSNFRFGNGPEFVLEGDEYRAGYNDQTPKFMYYRPDVLLINNLELDHPDIYQGLEDLKNVFAKLIAAMPDQGLVVYNADDQNVVDLVQNIKQNKFSFSFLNPKGDVKAESAGKDPADDTFLYKFKFSGRDFNFLTKFPGVIYGYNCLAAISVLLALGYQPEKFLDFIELYQGLKRRFEIVQDGDITVIDDYAHHPTAVLATLTAARQKYPDRRIIAVFEPHTYSRTAATLPQLAKAFQPADLVFISEVYPARESKLPSSITGEKLVDEISKNRKDVFYTANQESTQKTLNGLLKKGDVVVVMSVGPYKAI